MLKAFTVKLVLTTCASRPPTRLSPCAPAMNDVNTETTRGASDTFGSVPLTKSSSGAPTPQTKQSFRPKNGTGVGTREGDGHTLSTSRSSVFLHSSTSSSNSAGRTLVGNDTRRYLAHATARSQCLVDSMLTRLQTYKTFQPVLAGNGIYERHGAEAALNRARGSGFKASPTDGVHGSEHHPWSVIDEALDAAPLAMVKHNFEDHFLATMDGHKITADSGRRRGGAGRKTATHVIEAHDAGWSTAAKVPPVATDTTAAAAPEGVKSAPCAIDVHSIFMDAWRRDHPQATPEQIQRQSELWRKERAEAERQARCRHLAQLKRELEALVNQDRGDGAIVSTDTSRTLHDTAGTRADEGVVVTPHDAEWEQMRTADDRETRERLQAEQRQLWEQYREVERTAGRLADADDSRAESRRAPRKIVCDYEDDAVLHEWVEHGWYTHTHRHENAALLIQRTFRGYQAKRRVDRQRAARIRVFEETMRAEEVARQQWDVAVRISATRAGSGAEAERALRALQFFSNRITAVAEVRRARRRQTEQETLALRTYAATTVQRVYRGHRARQEVTYLRHPELWEALQHDRRSAAALAIQKIWIGYTTRRTIRRLQRAAVVVQCAFRSYTARTTAKRMRAARARLAAAELRGYAAAVIGRCCVRYIKRKRPSCLSDKPPLPPKM